MARFDGQVVWITGGGSGIGRACAVEFAQQGARVAVSGRRVEKLQDAVAAVQAVGGEAMAVACDVTDEASCTEAVAGIVKAWGRLDVAVANAGYAAAGWATALTVADWRRQFETNVFGVLNTAYASLPELEKQRGRLVLVGSVVCFFTPPKLAPYAASKAAVRAIGDGLSLELERSGVSVTTLCPGYVESEIQQVDNHGVHSPDRPIRKPALMWPADRAARSIVKAVHRRKRIAPITGHAHVLIRLARWVPGVLRLVVGRFG
jgi:NAD(P)-dependent dehydrogenase (short-subunit alcohol dehydrogenase family)